MSEQQFQVGDRVVITGDEAGWHHEIQSGDIGVVIDTDRGPGASGGWYSSGHGCTVRTETVGAWDVEVGDMRLAEPRSTPGPSTGTPEPSQAASEAHSDEVPFLGDDVRAPAMELVRSDDLARLREALEQVRALADQWGSERDQDTGMDGWDAGSDARRESDEEALRAVLASVEAPAPAVIDVAHLEQQRQWSATTFGPGSRLNGVLDHIRKELAEIEADPTDLGEWVDVLILAFDGAWRAGWQPQQIIDAIKAKQARNEARAWPDWRTADPEKAIEHIRESR